jgi:hypothetical protein
MQTVAILYCLGNKTRDISLCKFNGDTILFPNSFQLRLVESEDTEHADPESQSN